MVAGSVVVAGNSVVAMVVAMVLPITLKVTLGTDVYETTWLLLLESSMKSSTDA